MMESSGKPLFPIRFRLGDDGLPLLGVKLFGLPGQPDGMKPA